MIFIIRLFSTSAFRVFCESFWSFFISISSQSSWFVTFCVSNSMYLYPAFLLEKDFLKCELSFKNISVRPVYVTNYVTPLKNETNVNSFICFQCNLASDHIARKKLQRCESFMDYAKQHWHTCLWGQAKELSLLRHFIVVTLNFFWTDWLYPGPTRGGTKSASYPGPGCLMYALL